MSAPGHRVRNTRAGDLAAWAAVVAIVGVPAVGIGLLAQSALRSPAASGDQALVEVRRLPAGEQDGPFIASRPPELVVEEDGTTIRNPSWVVRPLVVYPAAATRAGIASGLATLKCEGLAEGRVGACEVVREEPAGYGFAEAAQAGTRTARLDPRQIDGVPTDFTIVFTTRFRLE